MDINPDESNPNPPSQTPEKEDSFSIDTIKNAGTETKPEEPKKTKSSRQPKEKFTPYHLTKETGIPTLIRKARRLNMKYMHNTTQKSDAVMALYREWIKSVYGSDQFEDVLSKIQDMSNYETIRALMDSYRDAEIQKQK